jgi:hypothetical protein
MWYGLYSSGAGYRPLEGSCEPTNEPSGSIKYWEILEYLRNWGFSRRTQIHGLSQLLISLEIRLHACEAQHEAILKLFLLFPKGSNLA